jgi:hypothetical protein
MTGLIPPSEYSYRLSVNNRSSRLILMENRPDGLIQKVEEVRINIYSLYSHIVDNTNCKNTKLNIKV